jgi:hypothetical protein
MVVVAMSEYDGLQFSWFYDIFKLGDYRVRVHANVHKYVSINQVRIGIIWGILQFYYLHKTPYNALSFKKWQHDENIY